MRQSEAHQEVEHLNALLKGELAAINSYSKALEGVKDPKLRETLKDCQTSHQVRAEKLERIICEDGETPECNTGSWGSFANFVIDGAKAVGDKAILAAIEEGEDVGSNDYEWRLVSMHGPRRSFVKEELLPEQNATHKTISELANSNFNGAWPPTPEPEEEV